MYIVTNRIRVKKGFAHKMAPNFTKPGPLLDFKGFVKVEVAISTQFEDYDEMNVNMYWESLEDFQVWRESDAFRKAHDRPSSEGENDSPLLGSQIVIQEVASTLEK